MSVDHLDGESFADPRKDQQRIAVNPRGQTVWPIITGDDRLAIIKKLPSRWPEVIMARERGDSIEEIARWAKGSYVEDCNGHCGDPDCLKENIAACYNVIESQLNDLAKEKAKWM